MGVADNIALVRKGYAAFSAGDAETLQGLFRADSVHSVPGSNPLSGDHKGPENILKMYGNIGALSEGTIRVELEDVLSNGADQVVAIHVSSAQRGGQTLRQREALLFTIEDGKVVSIQDFFADIDEQDRFWS